MNQLIDKFFHRKKNADFYGRDDCAKNEPNEGAPNMHHACEQQMDQVLHTLSNGDSLTDRIMELLEAPPLQLTALRDDAAQVAKYPEVVNISSIFEAPQEVTHSRMVAVSSVAAVIVFLALSLFSIFSTSEPTIVAAALIDLQDATGTVKLTRQDGHELPILLGKVDLPASTLMETGPDGYLTLTFDDTQGTTSITLYPDTRIRLISTEPAKSWDLEYGMIKASVAKQKQPFKIHSPHATAIVLGTEFEYSAAQNESQLHVTEGRVRLESLSGEAVLVRSGHVGRAHSRDEQIQLSVISDTPIKSPSISRIGLVYPESDNSDTVQYSQLNDGISLPIHTAQDEPLFLQLGLRHQKSSRLSVKLQNQAGEAILQQMLDVPARPQNLNTLENSPNDVTEYLIEIPQSSQLAGGFMTLILKAENTDTDYEASQSIERRLSFRLKSEL